MKADRRGEMARSQAGEVGSGQTAWGLLGHMKTIRSH